MQVIYNYFIVNNKSVHVSFFVAIHKQLIVNKTYVHVSVSETIEC